MYKLAANNMLTHQDIIIFKRDFLYITNHSLSYVILFFKKLWQK